MPDEATTSLSPPQPHRLRARISMCPDARQYALAQRAGIHDTILSKMLSGQRPMPREIEQALEQALDELEASR